MRFVSPDQMLAEKFDARMVMQVYQAADLSAETGQPVDIVVQEHPAEVPSLA